MNCDTSVTADDVLAFVDCVVNGGCNPCGVVIEIVTVGNPGNPGEQSRLQNSDPTFYGRVDYTFSMGKYEVTAGQYTEFLNAVAATDTHNLYNTRKDYDAESKLERLQHQAARRFRKLLLQCRA